MNFETLTYICGQLVYCTYIYMYIHGLLYVCLHKDILCNENKINTINPLTHNATFCKSI